MGIIETLTSRLGKKQRSAEAVIADIARREVDGKSAREDADRLQQALQATGKAPDYYTEVVGLFKRHQELEAQNKGRQKLEDEIGNLNRAMVSHEQDTEAYLKKREGELVGMNHKRGEINTQLKVVRKAEGALHALQIEHAHTLNFEAVDLDRYSLIVGENIVVHADSSAPYYEVTQELYRQESDRRIRIMERARELAKEEHEVVVGQYADSGHRTVGGGYAYKLKPPPTFAPPTWRDVVDHGWNKTLDEGGS